MPAPDLLAFLRGHLPDMLDELSTLVGHESPSSHPETMAPMFEHVADALGALGFRAAHTPGVQTGGALLCTRGGDGPAQLVVGHVDTVWPLGTLAAHPFAVADGVARGPGVYDMKAGIVQLLWALRAVDALGVELAVPPAVFLNADEEIASPESSAQLAALASGADRAFVLEPSSGPDGALKTARKSVAHYTVRAHGKAAHAGLEPERGVHAILAMSHAVQDLCALADPDRGITVNPGVIRGGTRRNVVPALCEVDVDVRAPTRAAAADVDAAIRALAPAVPSARLEVDGRSTKPPMVFTAGNRRLWARARSHGTALGLALDHHAVGGASDGNTTSQSCPTLDGLGAVGGGAHAVTEHVRVDTMPERAALLALLLLDPAMGDQPRSASANQ